MPGKILITEEEFRELCAKYTREEIAKMKEAGKINCRRRKRK